MKSVSTNISRALIKKIVDVIVATQHPEKIFLFGSVISGNTNKDSDIDLLIVKNTSEKKSRRAVSIYRELWNHSIKGTALDIFVVTPEELEKDKNVPFSFISEIFTKGKVLYG